MSSTLPHIQPGNWSLRCYRLLMKLYPQTFLAEFGDSIDQAFRDSLRDAFQTRGNWGVALLWLRIIPDFIFSVVELLTSTAGDYLKWYFRLRWVLACGLGFAVGQVAASSLVTAGVLNYLGLPRHWGLLGVPIWLSLGFFQSRVLTNRFCKRWQWTLLTITAGALGIVTTRDFSTSAPIQIAVTTGMLMGFFQWTAMKPGRGSNWQWAVACVCATSGAAMVAMTSAWMGLPNALHGFVVGATFGLISAIPLKRMLWPQSAEVSEQEPARDPEVS
jgi:hypothetical protein